MKNTLKRPFDSEMYLCGLWISTAVSNHFICIIDWDTEASCYVGRVLVNGEDSGRIGFKVGEEFAWFKETVLDQNLHVHARRKQGEFGVSYRVFHTFEGTIEVDKLVDLDRIYVSLDFDLTRLGSERYRLLFEDPKYGFGLMLKTTKKVLRELSSYKLEETKEKIIESSLRRIIDDWL